MSDEKDLGAPFRRAAYPSFYVRDLDGAKAFYSAVLGPPQHTQGDGLIGFAIGDDKLTLFDAKLGPHPDGGPRNAEFAMEVRTPADVDAVYERLIAAGAKAVEGFAPTDTWMYRRMRFACVDDPFGIRVDVFCPLPEDKSDRNDAGSG
jgi:catechol 2,3-dioxygenase-like lactoylglutathione lyase family enzyme